MKTIPIWIALLFLSFSAAGQEFPAYKVKSDFYEKERVVSGLGLCVPIKVNGKKMLLTAGHIVRNEKGKDADEILVDFPVGWIRCKIDKIDMKMDLCLIEPRLSPSETVEMDKKDNEQKQEVVNPNFFAKMEMKVNDGVILIKTQEGRWMANIPDYGHGSSGSPIYTKNGKLCGLSVAGYSEDGGKTMLFAIIVGRNEVKEFLQSEK